MFRHTTFPLRLDYRLLTISDKVTHILQGGQLLSNRVAQLYSTLTDHVKHVLACQAFAR